MKAITAIQTVLFAAGGITCLIGRPNIGGGLLAIGLLLPQL